MCVPNLCWLGPPVDTDFMCHAACSTGTYAPLGGMTKCTLCSNACACGQSNSAAGRDAKCDPVTGACTCPRSPAGSGSSGFGAHSVCTGWSTIVTHADVHACKDRSNVVRLIQPAPLLYYACGFPQAVLLDACRKCLTDRRSHSVLPSVCYPSTVYCVFMQCARRSTACNTRPTRAPPAPQTACYPVTAAVAVSKSCNIGLVLRAIYSVVHVYFCRIRVSPLSAVSLLLIAGYIMLQLQMREPPRVRKCWMVSQMNTYIFSVQMPI